MVSNEETKNNEEVIEKKEIEAEEIVESKYKMYLVLEEKKVKDILLMKDEEYEKQENKNSLVLYQEDLNPEETTIESIKDALNFDTKELFWEGYLYAAEESQEEKLQKEITQLQNRIIQENKKNERAQIEMLELIMSMM